MKPTDLRASIVHGGLKLRRIAQAIQENQPAIRTGKAAKIALCFGRWGTGGIADLMNHAGEQKGVRAAPGQCDLRKIPKPEAVVAVFDYAGRDHGPLAGVGGRRELTIPELSLRHVRGRFDESILVE
jgi:hypothetical protein